jgi:glycosyltransferase involved in cell wall biosynthesis
MFVTNSLTGGGAERSINLVCNELLRRNWQVCLVPINEGDPDQVVPECEVFPLNRQWRGTPLDTARALWRFNKTVRFWRPDIIVLNTDLPEMFGASLLFHPKLVAVEHSSIPWAKRTAFGKSIRRILAKRRVTWVSVSSHIDIWPERGKPHSILQNPISSRGDSKTPDISQIKRLVFIGRFSLEKRPEMALEIGAETGLVVEFIGDGALRRELETKASSRSIKARFRGQVNSPWAEIGTGDLLIVPSTTEGDGLVVLEGLQHGIPMLISDIPDFRRFGFPENNYCADFSAFVTRIKEFEGMPENLVVPFERADSILRERELSAVGDSWEAFLSSLS